MKSPSTRPAANDTRLFIAFLTLVLVIVYGVALYLFENLRQPVPLAALTVLFAAHIGLHWQIEKVVTGNPRQAIAYIVIQGLLAYAINSLAPNEAILFTVYMALIGEAVGMFGLRPAALLASLYYIALAALNLLNILAVTEAGWWLLGVIPTTLFTVIYVLLYLRQTQAREEAQILAAELESANRQLAEYAAQVEDLTIANERQRMARELHDTLSQGLAGIILQLEAVEAHLASQRAEKAREIIANTKTQARTTLAEARAVIDDLRNPVLENLDSALRREISRFEAATGIPCRYHSDSLPPLPAPVTETILRAVAEALTNIARHARASRANVTLTTTPTNLRIEIHDDGQGFDPDSIPSGHYGLLGIRERIRLIGGSLTLESAPQNGATLTLDIPNPAQADT